MNVGETDPTLRRMYFTIYVGDGSALALDAAVSPPVGAVMVSINGASFANAGGTLTHLGAGSYYYEATSGEVASAGFLAVKYQNSGYRTEIDWAFVGDLFTVGETLLSKLRLPFTVYDLNSPPALATGATASAGDLKISINGSAYANATGTMHEVGGGLYYYQAQVGDAASEGFIIVKYDHGSLFDKTIVSQSIDVISGGGGMPSPTFTSVTPDPGVIDPDPNVARWTPVVMVFNVPGGYSVVIQAQIGTDSALWMSAYDEKIAGATGQDALAPLFEDKSTVTFTGSVGTGRAFTASILPNGGWQRPDVKLVPYIAIEVS